MNKLLTNYLKTSALEGENVWVGKLHSGNSRMISNIEIDFSKIKDGNKSPRTPDFESILDSIGYKFTTCEIETKDLEIFIKQCKAIGSGKSSLNFDWFGRKKDFLPQITRIKSGLEGHIATSKVGHCHNEIHGDYEVERDLNAIGTIDITVAAHFLELSYKLAKKAKKSHIRIDTIGKEMVKASFGDKFIIFMQING